MKRSRTARFAHALLGGSLAVLALGPLSCRPASPRGPQPTLARASDAQRDFRLLRERWLLATPTERRVLEPWMYGFCVRYPKDPLARLGWAYLALLALDRDDLARAQQLATFVQKGPPGNTRDLGQLVEGVVLLRKKDPQKALQTLTPLVGKLLDSFAQPLLYESVVQAALESHRWSQALDTMDGWLRSAETLDRSSIRTEIQKLLRRFPPPALQEALHTLTEQPNRWEPDMQEVLVSYAATVALERSDGMLAQRVLDNAGAVNLDESQHTALAKLVYSSPWGGSQDSALIGWVLPQNPPWARLRETQALAGALEIVGPSSSPKAPLGPWQAPEITVRQAESDADYPGIFEQLDRHGALLLVGGFDPKSASQAAYYAETHQVPLLLLVAPSPAPPTQRYTFLVGEDESALLEAYEKAARSVGHAQVAKILPGQEALDAFTTGCDSPEPQAAEPFFPWRKWQASQVGALLLAGSGPCAEAVLTALEPRAYRPLLVFGLESVAPEGQARYRGPALMPKTGLVGQAKSTTPLLGDWLQKHPEMPSWFEALGRDTALLARRAVQQVGSQAGIGRQPLSQQRTSLIQALELVQEPLWSSETMGFMHQHKIARQIEWVMRSRP